VTLDFVMLFVWLAVLSCFFGNMFLAEHSGTLD
jgi:hypothetical protein